MAPPGGDIKFVFHRIKSKFPTVSHAKKTFFAYLYPKKVAKILSGPKKRPMKIYSNLYIKTVPGFFLNCFLCWNGGRLPDGKPPIPPPPRPL